MKARKLYLGIAIFCVFSLFLSGNVFSEVRQGAWDISAFTGGYRFEGNQPFKKDRFVDGLSLGYTITENLGVELSAAGIVNNELKGTDSNVDAYLLRADALYQITSLDEKLVPFVSLGAGTFNYDAPGADPEDEFLAEYGGGAKYFLTDDLSLRADVRHIIVVMKSHDFYKIDDHFNNLIYSVGLSYSFGGKAEAAPVVEAPVAKGPSDDDKDGVTNDLDQCPDTPAGVAVGPNGCPADSDGDGVADYLDKCPGTPAGASVDADGCPTDSDKDGVFDYLDQCANTPFGAKVDDRGCWTLENVGFKVNKADLTPEVKIKMKNVLDVLKKNPELKVSVEGHTDSTGSVTLNQKLSEKRAQAIKKYIIDSGISADRVVSAGFGLSKPIADNKTEAGRAKNRRVEIRPLN